jgi:kynurenine aminotransferase
LQEAAAAGLEEANKRNFFEIQRVQYEERRAVLVEAFDRLGLKYSLPEGSYFILLVCCVSMIH